MDMENYRIDVSYATFGIIVSNGVVINTAPIGKWMVGKSLSKIQQWVKQKQGTIDKLQ
jgi:hypothetical protein